MASPSREELVPESVEQLLEKIWTEKCLTTRLDHHVRGRLASIGEEEALQLLHKFSNVNSTIRNPNAYIDKMIDRHLCSSPSPTTPVKRLTFSPIHSPSSSSFSSPNNVRTVRLFDSPKPEPSRTVMPPSLSNHFPYATNQLLQGETSLQYMIPEQPPRDRDSGREKLEALGELEFRKQFLILSYCGGKELEKVSITAEDIRYLKDLSMIQFESKVWECLGKLHVERQDRRQYLEWDSGQGYIYQVFVSNEGTFRFKGPTLNKARTHLQKKLGDDNVLMVKFADRSDSEGPNFPGYSKIIREGIPVGLRRYRLFVFKEEDRKANDKTSTSLPVKCFFVRIESEAKIDKFGSYKLSDKPIGEARCFFMHAHTLSSMSKYMSRLSLILSKTMTLDIDWSKLKIETIEDEYCLDESRNRIIRDGKPLIQTDGTGYISEDLALKCPKNLYKGVCTNNQESEQGLKVPPMLLQCRLFYDGCAAKGTLLVNKKLPPNTIQVRDSMVKVQKDPNLPSDPTFNSLEIVSTSHAPKRTYLSKTLIALLSYGGVPNEYFLYILRNALEDSYSAFSNKRAALRVSIDYGNIDDNFTLAKMLSSGIPLEEPYLKHRLSILMKEEKKGLRTGKIYVPDSYYLTGTADPTGKLESDEVCVVLKNGQVSGTVLVYRNPGLHFGDVHVLKAKYVEELNDVIGNADGGIFFSCKGPRSVADEIAGGDFDGDTYWVSRNPQLLEDFKPSEPWTPNSELHKLEGSSEKPSDFSSPEEFENKLIELLFRKPSYTVGEAADSWMSWMDQFLTIGNDNNDHKYKVLEKIIKLIDIYYDALDAPKQGAKTEIPRKLKAKNYPHYMEKKAQFASESILGIIYDTVKAYQAEDQLNIEIKKLPYFEVEVSEDCLKKWTMNYKQYRSDMSIALSNGDREAKNEAAEEVIKYYKKLLYEAEEIDDSRRKREDIYKEALAIYHVTYDYAKTEADVRKCGFAWKVAGSALVEYFLMKQPEKPFMCVPSVLREVL